MNSSLDDIDSHFMLQALAIANDARARGEVPVGALIVENGRVGRVGRIIAKSGNRKEQVLDPLGHAEICVIRDASLNLGRWRLSGCTLYVTLEPCVMCAGAIVQARIDRVVYGAKDPKAGAVESLYQILSDQRLNHRPEIKAGVHAEQCGSILSEFFAERRLAKSR